jgi:signal transduction histidine kinase
MWSLAGKIVDYFVPAEARGEASNYMMVRTFVFLHLLGPLLGQSVIVFLYRASDHISWQFWAIEANLCFFWLMPWVVKKTRGLVVPATLSVNALVTLSLFGSFFYGGISSPFLPWLLIALLLGFFYLADRTALVLAGVAVQLTVFTTAHFLYDFPQLVPLESLWISNLLSILSALIYITLVALYYENVMRESSALEQAAHAHRRRADLEETDGWEEKAADLDRINAAGRHLNALVNDVLDLSRIEKDDLEVENKEIQLLDLIEETVATVEPLIRVHDNRLELQIPSDPGTIVSDPLKLRQSIINLLSNAAKFTSKGTITLTVMRRQTDAGDMVMIEVRDTGIGISRDGLKKLFNSFSQAEQNTSMRYGGTGLGLALTRRFCQSMGGTVDVESEMGVGSSFKIEIPAAPARMPEPLQIMQAGSP